MKVYVARNALHANLLGLVTSDIDRVQDKSQPVSAKSIVKNKQKIVNASNTASFIPKRKRLRLAAHSDVEDALMIWFTQAWTNKNKNITFE